MTLQQSHIFTSPTSMGGIKGPWNLLLCSMRRCKPCGERYSMQMPSLGLVGSKPFSSPPEDPAVHVHDMRRSTTSVARVNQYFFRIYVLKVIISPRWSLESLPHFLAQFLVIGRIYPWWKLVSKGRRLSLKPRYLEAPRGARSHGTL